ACLSALCLRAGGSILQNEERIFKTSPHGGADPLGMGVHTVFGGRRWLGWKFRSQSIAAPITKSAPKIDGKLDDPCWAKARKLTGLLYPEGAKVPEERQTEVFVIHDGKTLFIGAKCKGLFNDKIPDKAVRDDYSVWTQDHIEIYLDPTHKHRAPLLFAVGVSGTMYDAKFHYHGWMQPTFQFTDNKVGPMHSWNPLWEAKTARSADGWTVEIAIPLAELEVDLSSGTPCGLQIARGVASYWRRRTGESMTYLPKPFFPRTRKAEHIGGRSEYPDPTDFFDLTFSSPIEIEKVDLSGNDIFESDTITVIATNKTAKAQKVTFLLERGPVRKESWQEMFENGYAVKEPKGHNVALTLPLKKSTKTVILKPGKRSAVTLKTNMAPAAKTHARLHLVVSGAKGKYYDAYYYLMPLPADPHRPVFKNKANFDSLLADMKKPVWKPYLGTILSALASIDPKRAFPVALKLTKDPDNSVRNAATYALAKVGGPKAVRALTGLAEDKNLWTYAAATNALIQMNEKKSYGIIRKNLERMSAQNDRYGRINACHLARVVYNNGSQKKWAMAFLEKRALAEGHPNVQQELFDVIRSIATKKDVPMLRRILKQRVAAKKDYPIHVMLLIEAVLDNDDKPDLVVIKERIDYCEKNELLLDYKTYFAKADAAFKRVKAKFAIRAKGGKPTKGGAKPDAGTKLTKKQQAIELAKDIEAVGYGWNLTSTLDRKRYLLLMDYQRLDSPAGFPLLEEWSLKFVHTWWDYMFPETIQRIGTDAAWRMFVRKLSQRRGQRIKTHVKWRPKSPYRPPWKAKEEFRNHAGKMKIWSNIMGHWLEESIHLAWYYRWHLHEEKFIEAKQPPPEPYVEDYARFAFATLEGDLVIFTGDNRAYGFDPSGKRKWIKNIEKLGPFDKNVVESDRILKKWDLTRCSYNAHPNPPAVKDPLKALPKAVKAGRSVVTSGLFGSGKTKITNEKSGAIPRSRLKPNTIYLLSLKADANTKDTMYQSVRDKHELHLTLTAGKAVILKRGIIYPSAEPTYESLVFSTGDEVVDMKLTLKNKGLATGHVVSEVKISPLSFSGKNRITEDNFELKGRGLPALIEADPAALVNGRVSETLKFETTKNNKPVTMKYFTGAIEEVPKPGRHHHGTEGYIEFDLKAPVSLSTLCIFGAARDYTLEYQEAKTGKWRILAAGMNQRKNYQFIEFSKVTTSKLRYHFRLVSDKLPQFPPAISPPTRFGCPLAEIWAR
ncbi:MAG: HEAT repeat domain-containing protein, partial [Planctomycetia bacterium]|nr:HEAT repeat domain-containing protein [Planctomycetia bacterium]